MLHKTVARKFMANGDTDVATRPIATAAPKNSTGLVGAGPRAALPRSADAVCLAFPAAVDDSADFGPVDVTAIVVWADTVG